MSEIDTPKATGLVASHFAKYSTDLIGFVARDYGLSIHEMAIVALVFGESTRPLREDSYLASKFGFEDRPLPNEYRLAVNLKFLHTSLGLSRETTRRKLERLVTDGYLARVNGGYVFLQPGDRPELSRGLRNNLLSSIESIALQANRPRSPE